MHHVGILCDQFMMHGQRNIKSLPIDMLLSAVSVLVVAQSSSEVTEGLMNNPVYIYIYIYIYI